MASNWAETLAVTLSNGIANMTFSETDSESVDNYEVQTLKVAKGDTGVVIDILPNGTPKMVLVISDTPVDMMVDPSTDVFEDVMVLLLRVTKAELAQITFAGNGVTDSNVKIIAGG